MGGYNRQNHRIYSLQNISVMNPHVVLDHRNQWPASRTSSHWTFFIESELNAQKYNNMLAQLINTF